MDVKEMTAVQAIKTFFGMLPGTTLTDFMRELKALTPEDKRELATGAAAQLGVTLKD
jgi:hypothetical protein